MLQQFVFQILQEIIGNCCEGAMDHIQWLPYEYEYEFDRLLRYRYILYHSTNANTFFVTGIKPARSAAMPVLFLLSGPKWVAPINVKFGEITVTILEPHAILQGVGLYTV